MKVVILAGGYGTRISEESHLKPKPMIEIGDKPILWHIMKEYGYYGYHDFIICCGYKQHVVKEWFADYYLYNCDVTFDFTRENRMEIHNSVAEPWRVTLVDTGLNTMTGGRVRRVRKYIGDEPFMLTYGDGVSDINIHDLVKFHQSHGKMVTLTAVNVEQRFGVLELGDGDEIRSFREKSIGDRSRINAGYMVCQPEIFDYIAGDETVFEKEPLERVAALGQLVAYKHNSFWQCMDTKREKEKLDALWKSGEAPWNVWKD
ncbi:MAG: glucose-1-phosphate cytidylyltransferase [Lachnospiraceae bacterium]|jgi:glucose-1-phosphate cytidylyltransferase|nr:glucose-1-phosphate cytidylyltransferase [Lachnospiraceae bacterium]